MTFARKLWNSSLTASGSSSRFVCTQVTLDNTEAVWKRMQIFFLNVLQYIFLQLTGNSWFQSMLQMYIKLKQPPPPPLPNIFSDTPAICCLGVQVNCLAQEHGTRMLARLNPRPLELQSSALENKSLCLPSKKKQIFTSNKSSYVAVFLSYQQLMAGDGQTLCTVNPWALGCVQIGCTFEIKKKTKTIRYGMVLIICIYQETWSPDENKDIEP